MKHLTIAFSATLFLICSSGIRADSNQESKQTIEILQEEGFIDKDNKAANWYREHRDALNKPINEHIDEAKQSFSKKLEQGYNKVFAPERDPERMQEEQERVDAANREALREQETQQRIRKEADERMNSSVSGDKNRCNALAGKTSPQAEAYKAECLKYVDDKWREMGTCWFGKRNPGVSVEQCQRVVASKYDMQIGRLEIDKSRGLDIQPLQQDKEPLPTESKETFQQLLDEGMQKREKELRDRASDNDRKAKLNAKLQALQHKIDRGDLGVNQAEHAAFDQQVQQNENALGQVREINSTASVSSDNYNGDDGAAEMSAIGNAALGAVANMAAQQAQKKARQNQYYRQSQQGQTPPKPSQGSYRNENSNTGSSDDAWCGDDPDPSTGCR